VPSWLLLIKNIEGEKCMKKNTGCGCNSHNNCPPKLDCDVAEPVHSDCEDFKLPFCPTKPKFPVADIPIALRELELEIDLETNIHLPKFARDIKSIKKNVSLTQCKALPSSRSPFEVKLFLSGVVHKNIQFVEDCNGYVRDFSVNVPFHCFRRIKLANPVRDPFGHKDIEFSQKTSFNEYRELDKDGHGANECITGSETFEAFNEPVKCKLLKAKIRDFDIFKHFDNWGRFDKITEKMEVRLWLKLLQTQQVSFDPSPDCDWED
jgi:hypothetical protein